MKDGELEIGDVAKIVGLTKHREVNGMFIEVCESRQRQVVPTAEGPIDAEWYGCVIINNGATGYFRQENLEYQKDVTLRGVCIHLFGTERAPWERPAQ